MLTGNEKIKDLENYDICNYIGLSLCNCGVIGVHIDTVKGASGSYSVLYVYFNSGRFCRIAFNSPRALNTTIDDIRKIILKNIALSSGASKQT